MDGLTEKASVVNSYISHYDFILVIPSTEPVCFSSRLRLVFNAKLGLRSGVVIDGQQADELIELYSLYAFSGKIIVGSIDLPHGRKLRNLLKSGIATEDELIDDVILGVMNEQAT